MNRRFGPLRRASGACRSCDRRTPPRERDVVRAFELVVPPGDARLGAEAVQVGLESRAALRFGDAVADRAARLLERPDLGVGARFELENLVAAGRPDDVRHLADLELLQNEAKLWRELLALDWADQPAVGLRR